MDCWERSIFWANVSDFNTSKVAQYDKQNCHYPFSRNDRNTLNVSSHEKAFLVEKNGKSNKRKVRKVKIKCTYGKCKQTFKSNDALMYHVTTYHAKGINKTLECHLCQKQLTSLYHLQSHIDTKHTGIKRHTCEFGSCSKSFTRKESLKVHIDVSHTKPNVFQCMMCPKNFVRKSELSTHLTVFHREGAYSCELCNRKCLTKGGITKHMKVVHNGQSLIRCPVCLVTFSNKRQLSVHRLKKSSICGNIIKSRCHRGRGNIHYTI